MNPLHAGDKVLHRYNRDLGPGEVIQVRGDRVLIHFPHLQDTLEFSLENHAFTPLRLPAGTDPALWHEAYHEDLVERLARLEVDTLTAWRNRIESLALIKVREAEGLGSFLGGRIEIFPHQLHVAEQAVATDPVRWLLADEVGLGKTVEACLILSHLVRTHRAENVVVIAPQSLTVQWLGELYRKFHQVFVLMNKDRLADVRRDLGEDFNPFTVHPRSVVALEDLVNNPWLTKQAKDSGVDLLVVDEAHRLERRRNHPGSPAYRTVSSVCRVAPHVLLLSATPMEADTHGFFELMRLLWPKEYPSADSFEADLSSGQPLFPCTSATTRSDIGGLPPRERHPVELPPWSEYDHKINSVLSSPPGNVLQKKRRAERLLKTLEEPTGADDLRLDWVVQHYRTWQTAGDKMLIFVNRRASLDFLKTELERRTMSRVAVFHEDLPTATRDLEVAQFALPDGPTMMISTEAGGEGRNFEFCRGLILFDLPWSPGLVEQRIGRLDRINRRRPVEIYYFVPQHPFAAQLVRLYEALGVFTEPLGGLDRSLAHVEEAIIEAVQDRGPQLDIQNLVEETRRARDRVSQGLYHTLHQNRYTADLAPGIKSRIPAGLHSQTKKVVLEACRQFGFDVVEKQGRDTWYFEFGNEAVIDHVPNVGGETRWLGTFDREEAVHHETIDFFASGHPLVEGILLELKDGHRGEVTMLDIPNTGISAAGLMAWIQTGATAKPVVFDFEGVPQPDWEHYFTGSKPQWKGTAPIDWGLESSPQTLEGWGERVRAILYPCQAMGSVAAIAAFRLLP